MRNSERSEVSTQGRLEHNNIYINFPKVAFDLYWLSRFPHALLIRFTIWTWRSLRHDIRIKLKPPFSTLSLSQKTLRFPSLRCYGTLSTPRTNLRDFLILWKNYISWTVIQFGRESLNEILHREDFSPTLISALVSSSLTIKCVSRWSP